MIVIFRMLFRFGGTGGSVAPSSAALLMETGSNLLLESGDRILLEP